MNGAEGMAAVIVLGLNTLAWPVLFAFRKISFTSWPRPPRIVPAAVETPSAAGTPSPSGRPM